MTPEEINSKYFKIDAASNSTTFIGVKWEAFIPRRYEDLDVFLNTDVVETLGVFGMRIDDKVEVGLLLATIVTLGPSSVTTVTIDDEQMFLLTFNKGDKFLVTNNYIVNDKFAYLLWVEFITLGKLPKFLTYDQMTTMFDRISKACQISFDVDHSVFETLYGQLYRDVNDISTLFRNTPMTGEGMILGLRNAPHAAGNTLSKLLGSYPDTAINSALVNQNEHVSDIEFVLRA